LSTQGLFYHVVGDRFYGADSCVWKPPGGLRENSFSRCDHSVYLKPSLNVLWRKVV
jgi:hypothetical protein